MNNNIYVYFACFHDSEVIPTIINIYEKATHPSNVSVGIDFQWIREDIKNEFQDWVSRNPQYKIRVNYIEYTYKNFWEIVGLAKGRQRAYALREDEAYALLVDGHSLFAPNWDTKLIDKYTEAEKQGIQKPILHGYAGYYVLEKETRNRVWLPSHMATIRYQYYVNYNEEDRHQKEARFKWHERLPTFIITKENPNTNELIPNVKFSGNFSFTRYDICEHLPSWVLFEDEEIPWSINLFDAGFSFVFPSFNEPVIGHLYMGATEPWFEARATRDNIEFYIPNNDVEGFLRMKDENINKFLDDPANYEKIINYQNYAHVSIISGETEEYYIPKSFR